MVDIYQGIVDLLNNEENLILASIISQIGPSPAKLGASFVIREDGTFLGTLGGGKLESDILTLSKELFHIRKNRLIHIEMKGEDVAGTDMLCGGILDIYLEFISKNSKSALNIFSEAVRIRKRGGKGIIITFVYPETVAKDIYKSLITEKEVIAPVESEKMILSITQKKFSELLRKRKPGFYTLHNDDLVETKLTSVKMQGVYLEPVLSVPTVYIFGGGHISQKLAPLVKMVNFKVVVIDDRAEFADQARFPDADEVILEDFSKVFEKIQIDETSYLVIVTRGHLSDNICLEMALKTDAIYIGMIGSRRKRDLVYKKIIKKGISKEVLDRVHAPIGLNINAETPEEIAISIVAELIKVRGDKLPLGKKDWKV